MDVWREATNNWSELRVAMGCEQIKVRGGLIHVYPIQRSGTFYNSSFVQQPKSFMIEEIERLFEKRNLPFSIILPSLKPYAALRKSLERQQYSLAPAWVLMTHGELTGETSPEFRVVEIDSSRLCEWFELQDAFPHAESSTSTRLKMIENVSKQKSSQLLMASLHGRPVGAGLLFMKGEVASIHMVATLDEFRRRHVATTVTLEAIRRARENKAGLIWLRTRKSGIGEKVYSRIGFTAFSDILSYTKTPQDEDSNLPPK